VKQLLATLGWTAPAHFAPSSARAADAQVEAIRQAMLDVLGWPVPRGCEGLLLRIQHALDAERLWYLRGDLMQALAYKHGEQPAAEQLARISAMFQGVLPPSLASSQLRY